MQWDDVTNSFQSSRDANGRWHTIGDEILQTPGQRELLINTSARTMFEMHRDGDIDLTKKETWAQIPATAMGAGAPLEVKTEIAGLALEMVKDYEIHRREQALKQSLGEAVDATIDHLIEAGKSQIRRAVNDTIDDLKDYLNPLNPLSQQQSPSAPSNSATPADPDHPKYEIYQQVRTGVIGMFNRHDMPFDDDKVDRYAAALMPDVIDRDLKKVDSVWYSGRFAPEFNNNYLAVQNPINKRDPHLMAFAKVADADVTPAQVSLGQAQDTHVAQVKQSEYFQELSRQEQMQQSRGPTIG